MFQEMNKHWKTVFLPMTIVLVVLIGVTYWVSLWHGGGFWDVFFPQFFATVFGVIFTVMFAYAIWLRQQKVAKSLQLQQLLEDLKFEVSENLKWLENLKTFLGEPSRPEYISLDRGLKTITMKYALNPEKLLLLRDFDLADELDRTVGHCEEFNDNYHRRFRQLLVEEVVASTEQDGRQRARIAFGVEILSDVGYYRRILEQLMNKLVKQTTRSSDTPAS